jgi:hypothetical protein
MNLLKIHIGLQTGPQTLFKLFYKGGFFFFFINVIQQCFTCRPSDSTVSKDAAIEPKTVATLEWTAKALG